MQGPSTVVIIGNLQHIPLNKRRASSTPLFNVDAILFLSFGAGFAP